MFYGKNLRNVSMFIEDLETYLDYYNNRRISLKSKRVSIDKRQNRKKWNNQIFGSNEKSKRLFKRTQNTTHKGSFQGVIIEVYFYATCVQTVI
ncbi:MAG: hypothetical protein LBE09_06605 [Christensenellaceae bacterium]|nr:hypothetical protein [Christensenellaceae bacterium]